MSTCTQTVLPSFVTLSVVYRWSLYTVEPPILAMACWWFRMMAVGVGGDRFLLGDLPDPNFRPSTGSVVFAPVLKANWSISVVLYTAMYVFCMRVSSG